MNNQQPIEASVQAASPTSQRRRYESKPKGAWMKIVGSMKNCDLSHEAFRLGEEWREQMNREGHLDDG